MARYVAGECYKYTGNQATAVNNALSAIISEYSQVTFSNAIKKTEMDGYINEIKSEMTGYSSSLMNATFAPTR